MIPPDKSGREVGFPFVEVPPCWNRSCRGRGLQKLVVVDHDAAVGFKERSDFGHNGYDRSFGADDVVSVGEPGRRMRGRIAIDVENKTFPTSFLAAGTMLLPQEGTSCTLTGALFNRRLLRWSRQTSSLYERPSMLKSEPPPSPLALRSEIVRV